MSFVRRPYEEIVADLLTQLTQGVAGERHVVLYDPAARPPELPEVVLRKRPVRRVSLVRGVVEPPSGDGDPVPRTFTLSDFELLPGTDDPDDRSRLRFLPFGRKPAPGSEIVVNYYPRNADPTVLTDVHVGSVTRTLVEAVSRELAVLYEQLDLAYDSGFVETASGSALDRVVALLGTRRFEAGRPVGSVRFSRRPGSVGTITIPPGVPITDAGNTVRYDTVETQQMLAGESTVEVLVRGADEATAVVDAGILTVTQRAIAGIDAVTNDRPTRRATESESDEELRRRARGALLASHKGTVDALRSGLLAMPDVRSVRVRELPNGVPGEIEVFVGMEGQAGDELPRPVLERIEDLRAAGIRVHPRGAAGVRLQARVALVLGGSGLPDAELVGLERGVAATLSERVARLGIGEKVRAKALTAAVLADERIVDATIALAPAGTAPVPDQDFEPAGDAVVELGEVTFDTPTFADAAGPAEVVVEVTARAVVEPADGQPLEAVRSALTAKLENYLARLAPASRVTHADLLAALRDDARYALDPLGLRVSLAAGDQFVQIVHGGESFEVRPDHVFEVTEVEAVPTEGGP